MSAILDRIKTNRAVNWFYSGLVEPRLPKYQYYRRTKEFLSVSEFWDKERLNAMQLQKMQAIVEHAWMTVPAYRSHWKKNHFIPKDLQSLADIQRIPFVTKDMIRDDLKGFSSKKITKKIFDSTGGTYGVPMEFFVEPQSIYIERAFIADLWRRRYPQMPMIPVSTILRGTKIDGSISQFNPRHGLFLSTLDIKPANAHQYAALMDQYKTPLLQAFPSALYLLAMTFQEKGIQLKHRFSGIMLGSESLYDFQRKLIEQTFGAKITHWFGQSERVVLAGNCEHEDTFHVYPQYGMTEVVNPDGKYTSRGQSGEIVGTGFFNFATPLIRYKTNDFATPGADHCAKCGRHYQLFDRIDGRLQEFLVGKNGALVSLSDTNMHNDVYASIRQFRFVQKEVGKVTFCYVRRGVADETKISAGLKTFLRQNFELQLQEVDSIPPGANGKLKILEQHLDIKQFLS
jgi:phenylacetate-CoA ligase